MIICKFNILEIEQGVKWGWPKQFIESFWLACENGQKRPKSASPIYLDAQVC